MALAAGAGVQQCEDGAAVPFASFFGGQTKAKAVRRTTGNNTPPWTDSQLDPPNVWPRWSTGRRVGLAFIGCRKPSQGTQPSSPSIVFATHGVGRRHHESSCVAAPHTHRRAPTAAAHCRPAHCPRPSARTRGAAFTHSWVHTYIHIALRPAMPSEA